MAGAERLVFWNNYKIFINISRMNNISAMGIGLIYVVTMDTINGSNWRFFLPGGFYCPFKYLSDPRRIYFDISNFFIKI